MLIGTTVATDASGARLRITVTAQQPVDGSSSAAAPYVDALANGCPGEYDADVFASLDAQIMRADVTAVADKGSWNPATAIEVRPTASDSDSLGLTADGIVGTVGDGSAPYCRGSPQFASAGEGHVYLVLSTDSGPLDWRTLTFGVSPVTGGGAVTFSGCGFTFSTETAATAKVTTAPGCVATVGS